MAAVREALDTVRISVYSPDRTVHVELAADRTPRVRLRPGSLREQTETSLATQVQQALAGFLAGHNKASRSVLGIDGQSPPVTESSSMDAKITAERARRARTELECLDIKEQSPEGGLRMRYGVTRGIRMKFAPDVVRAGQEECLEREISELFLHVLREHTSRAIAVLDEANELERHKLEREIHERRDKHR